MLTKLNTKRVSVTSETAKPPSPSALDVDDAILEIT